MVDHSAQQESRPSNTLLTSDALTVAFGGLVAVNAVSLHVRTGEVFGLIGPNGAGKTTMFNAMTGFTIPTSGRILFADQDITALPSWKRARMGLARTFQNLRLFPGDDGLSDSADRPPSAAVGRTGRAIAGHETCATGRPRVSRKSLQRNRVRRAGEEDQYGGEASALWRSPAGGDRARPRHRPDVCFCSTNLRPG